MTLTILSRTEKGREFLRLLIDVFIAWRDGRLVTPGEAAADAADAADAAGKTGKATRPGRSPSIEPNYPSATRPDFNRSRFAFGRPASVPSSFVESVAANKRLTRFPTKLDITVTIMDGAVFIFDADLGHAIGGDCTHKARPTARRMSEALRMMGPEPITQIRSLQWNKMFQTESGVFTLNHEQAKAVAEVLDPVGYTDVQYRLDMLFYLIANGRLTTTADSAEGYEAAQRLDAATREKKDRVAARYKDKPIAPKAAPLPAPPAPDPYHTIMLGEMMDRRLDELAGQVDGLAKGMAGIQLAIARMAEPPAAALAAPAPAPAVPESVPADSPIGLVKRFLGWAR
ncbi:MAG: hypothetical protein K2P80_05165 [Beijerinckiaceae bacterium]|nr:hypothetical protein [Beijerinckiaceae bacterium]